MLAGWIAAVIGIIIVVFSLNRIIGEIRKRGVPNLEDQSFSDTFYTLLNRVDQQGENLDDINQTFYETVERLEKRIEALERKTLPTEPGVRPRPRPASYLETSEALQTIPLSPPAREFKEPIPEEVVIASQIRRLLAEGKDSQQIARELNLGVGEVELIRRLKSSPTK